ncbi:uncharacterized protein N7459_006840 [Penicillium hispanicum]|uniref:uncharacterized protein n=1 Tax=Penicillium hispanicum TaxID=1080232 RepID=UPI002540AE1E|nr:uncharacterized protein N7459_006840 [Penicillium hispanicum]KAJ5577876.1 hypothetical protein N7459_006840 [Penicillium hispanicum]
MIANVISQPWQKAQREAHSLLQQYQRFREHKRNPTKSFIFHPNQPSILRFPENVYTEIANRLPLEDRVCFALTCKPIFMRLHRILQAPDLQYPHDRVHDERPFLRRRNIEKHPRTKLVRRLETSHWKYCIGCWKLHPRSEWKSNSPLSEHSLFDAHHHPRCGNLVSRRTPHNPKDLASPKQTLWLDCFATQPVPAPAAKQPLQCTPRAGIVDLCPCLSITFHHKQQLVRLVESLRSRPAPATSAREFFYDNLFEYTPSRSNSHTLCHFCAVHNNPFFRVFVCTMLTLKKGCLYVHSSYKVYVGTATGLPAGLTPPFDRPPSTGWEAALYPAQECWSGVDVSLWFARFKRFLDDPESDFYREAKDGLGRGRDSCDPVLERDRSRSPQDGDFEIITQRNLGSGDSPDENWRRARRVEMDPWYKRVCW